LFRILGGSKSLIFALQSTLDQNNIHLNHITTNIKKNENTQQLSATHKGIEQNLSGNKLMIAMPSRIIAKKLANKKWISRLLLTVLQNTQVWMAGQAKFVVGYDKPFSCKQTLTGRLLSQLEPMIEVHDASTGTDINHRLFGFIG
jgi:monoamine oxidase